MCGHDDIELRGRRLVSERKGRVKVKKLRKNL